MEHLHHFKLAEDPFRNEPLLRFLFESRQQQDALRRMDRAVRQAKGLCVLIGDVGSGKTIAVRQLLESLEEEVFEAGMLVVLNGAADSVWMLTRFARQLGVEDPPAEREALIAEVYDRLAIVREDGRHAVLIIDDAQALASPSTLAEVCGLLKLEYEDRRLLTLVLAGTPSLADALASDPALAHRVDVRVQLEPFDAATTSAYIAHRLRSAGGDPEIFQPVALSALHAHGRGIPGLMNTLADNALFEAFLCGRSAVTVMDVERAHRDLGWDPPEEGARAATKTAAAPTPAATPAPAPARAPASQEDPHARVAPPPAASGDDSLSDLDSELEAVFDTAARAASSRPSIDPTSPEAISAFQPARPAPVTPREGPPKDEPITTDDLLVELIDD